jgi:hypothetical protein
MKRGTASILLSFLFLDRCDGFASMALQLFRTAQQQPAAVSVTTTTTNGIDGGEKINLRCIKRKQDIRLRVCREKGVPDSLRRREVWKKGGAVYLSILISSAAGGPGPSSMVTPLPASAAVGTLPELANTNAFVQGITVQVADKSQQDAMIAFLVEGFDFQILRKRIRGGVEETWLGFGPEQLDVPSDFEIPVSSFAKYGGHASVHLVYDSATKAPLYRVGSDAPPGDSVAYLQVSVPAYRISKILVSGGVITDAYGLVNAISPSGLPVRGIIGVWPDPLMLVAINCRNVQESLEFYRSLGFVQLPVPYSRPSNGATIFEPYPPPGSVYVSPCTAGVGMGVLLIPRKGGPITPNRAVKSLDLVYTPSSSTATAATLSDGDALSPPPVSVVVDPSGVPISFQPVSDFQEEERVTR